MKILGIETSCDETAAAVVEDGANIVSNVVASQVDIHRRYGDTKRLRIFDVIIGDEANSGGCHEALITQVNLHNYLDILTKM
jgi:hypothetical protein